MRKWLRKIMPGTRCAPQKNARVHDLLHERLIKLGVVYRLTLASDGKYYVEVEAPRYETWEKLNSLDEALSMLSLYTRKLDKVS